MEKTKQTQFLQQLGYTIEDITYVVWHDGGRDDDYTYTEHEINLAYKVETDEIKKFKEQKSHPQTQEGHLRRYVLINVYKEELENTLYEMALEHVSSEYFGAGRELKPN